MQLVNGLNILATAFLGVPQNPEEAAVQQRQLEPIDTSSTSTIRLSSRSTSTSVTRPTGFPTLTTTSTQASSISGVVPVFLDEGSTTGAKWNAAIVTGCAAHTVYVVRCYEGPRSLSAICGPNAASLTVTEGPSTYAVSTAVSGVTMGITVVGTVAERCDLNPLSAVCTYFVYGSGSSAGSVKTTKTTSTATYRGTDYARSPVTITAGAEKLGAMQSECPAPPPFPPAIGPNAAAGFNMRAILSLAVASVALVVGLLTV